MSNAKVSGKQASGTAGWQASWTNTTYYIDPYDTQMDQKDKLITHNWIVQDRKLCTYRLYPLTQQ